VDKPLQNLEKPERDRGMPPKNGREGSTEGVMKINLFPWLWSLGGGTLP
jgi:hypothetical protein